MTASKEGVVLNVIPTTLASPRLVTVSVLPEADKTHLQMMMVFAEHEARAISARTKAALAACKGARNEAGRAVSVCCQIR